MKFVLQALAAVLACSAPFSAKAQTSGSESTKAERLRDAMKSARWTGPLQFPNLYLRRSVPLSGRRA